MGDGRRCPPVMGGRVPKFELQRLDTANIHVFYVYLILRVRGPVVAFRSRRGMESTSARKNAGRMS